MMRMSFVVAPVMFSALIFLSQSRVMAQRPPPAAIVYSEAKSGEQGVSWTSGWSAQVTWTDDDPDTDGASYFTNSCEATSTNGGSLSYDTKLTIILTNYSGADGIGTWSGYKSLSDTVYPASLDNTAYSDVTGGSELGISGEAYNPDNEGYGLTSAEYDECTTMTLPHAGGSQTFTDWLEFTGDAEGSAD